MRQGIPKLSEKQPNSPAIEWPCLMPKYMFEPIAINQIKVKIKLRKRGWD